MKNLPVCQACLISGFLCSSCQKKLDDSEITDFDLDLAKFLTELEEKEPNKYGYLKDVSFHKAIDFEDVLIVIVGNKDRIRISRELLDLIKETYEIDHVILIEKTKKPRPVVDGLIAPAKLLSLNEIFLATGEVEFKAVLNQTDKESILFTVEELEELIHELTGSKTRIEFQ